MSDWLVCAVDRSDHARDVIRAAARFACDLRLRLMVACFEDASQVEPECRDDSAQVSPDDLQAWMAQEPSIRWDAVLRVEHGRPARELLHLTRECDARMLVVGSDPQCGLGAVALGGRSQRLGGKLRCPVLVVPAAADRASPEHPPRSASSVLCAVADLGKGELTLAHAAEVAWAWGARLVLAHVVQVPETLATGAPLVGATAVADKRLRRATRTLERLAKQLAPGQSCEPRLRFGDPLAEIDRLAAGEGADLIVVGEPRGSARRASMAGSPAAELAARASRPVLVVPEAATSGRLRRFCPSSRLAPALAEA